MADKKWAYIKDKDGNKIRFIPVSPEGNQLGGVSASQVAAWNAGVDTNAVASKLKADSDFVASCKGEPGDAGSNGSDAQVTTANVASALGYGNTTELKKAAPPYMYVSTYVSQANPTILQLTDAQAAIVADSTVGAILLELPFEGAHVYTKSSSWSGNIILFRTAETRSTADDTTFLTQIECYVYDSAAKTLTLREAYDKAIAQQKDTFSQYLPQTSGTTGQVLTRTSDGATWQDAQGGSGGGVSDVTVNGTSIVSDGVAAIPLGAHNAYGLQRVPPSDSSGLEIVNGNLYVNSIGNSAITNRSTSGLYHQALTIPFIDNAVKAAMCDGKGDAWTSDEQAAARERIGIGEWTQLFSGTLDSAAIEVIAINSDTALPYTQIFIATRAKQNSSNVSGYVVFNDEYRLGTANFVSAAAIRTVYCDIKKMAAGRWLMFQYEQTGAIGSAAYARMSGLQTVYDNSMLHSMSDLHSIKILGNTNLPVGMYIEVYAR